MNIKLSTNNYLKLYVFITKRDVYITIGVKLCIYNLKHNYIYISLLYIYIYTYTIIYKVGTMYLQVCQIWIHIKNRKGGDWGRMPPPPKKK